MSIKVVADDLSSIILIDRDARHGYGLNHSELSSPLFARMSKFSSIKVWGSIILCFVTTSGQNVIKLGFVYDPSGPFSNALLGYNFYAHKINSAGGLAVGLNGTTYQIEIVKHSNNNRTDPYWLASGSRKFSTSHFLSTNHKDSLRVNRTLIREYCEEGRVLQTKSPVCLKCHFKCHY